MKSLVKKFLLSFTAIALLVGALPGGSAAADKNGQESTSQPPSTSGTLALEDLEKMALERNPTLAQAEADVRASEGRKVQAGLYPNPVIGYEGREISFGPIIRAGEHGFFVRQSIVTGGKLGLSRKVFAEEQSQAESVAKAQRYRVLNAVQLAYYDALGAHRLVEVRGELAKIAREAVVTSKQLYNVGQADQPDVIEASVEAQRVDLDLVAAQHDQERVWQQLAAAVGNPSLPLTPLAGKLDDPLPTLNREGALQTILRDSPEVKIAEDGVARAELALKRARVEKLPDIQLRGGLDDNRELLEQMGRPVGWEGSVEVGVQIPIFNRNQGNIKTAAAELVHARQETERVKLALRFTYANPFREYSDALVTAQRYRQDMLPQAQKAYEMYLQKYREMGAAYPQVLIAQRTYFQLQEDYVKTLMKIWQAAVEIKGFLLVDGLAAPVAPGEPATVSPGVEVRPAGMP